MRPTSASAVRCSTIRAHAAAVLLVVEVADRQAADAFLQASPYTAAGLYARTWVEEIRPEIGSLR